MALSDGMCQVASSKLISAFIYWGQQRPGGPRVYHRREGLEKDMRRRGHRHCQEADGLRFPRPHHVVAGGWQPHDRAHRVGGQGWAGQVSASVQMIFGTLFDLALTAAQAQMRVEWYLGLPAKVGIVTCLHMTKHVIIMCLSCATHVTPYFSLF